MNNFDSYTDPCSKCKCHACELFEDTIQYGYNWFGCKTTEDKDGRKYLTFMKFDYWSILCILILTVFICTLIGIWEYKDYKYKKEYNIWLDEKNAIIKGYKGSTNDVWIVNYPDGYFLSKNVLLSEMDYELLQAHYWNRRLGVSTNYYHQVNESTVETLSESEFWSRLFKRSK